MCGHHHQAHRHATTATRRTATAAVATAAPRSSPALRARDTIYRRGRIRAASFFYATQVVEYQYLTRLEEKKLKKLPYALAKALLRGIVCVLTERSGQQTLRSLKS